MESSVRSTTIPPRLRAVGVALLLAVVGVGGGGALSLGASFALSNVGVSLPPVVVIVLLLGLMQVVGLGGTALAYVRYRGVTDYVRVRLPNIRDALLAVAGYVAALGGVILVGVVVQAVGVEAGSNQISEVAADVPIILLVLIPASFLIIGPFEELLFRGVVQTRLRESFGPAPGIVLASLLFAAVHVVALSGGLSARLVTIGILFLPSLAMGIAYELSDNLAVPVFIHGAYDATLFSLLYVAIQLQEFAPQSPALV